MTEQQQQQEQESKLKPPPQQQEPTGDQTLVNSNQTTHPNITPIPVPERPLEEQEPDHNKLTPVGPSTTPTLGSQSGSRQSKTPARKKLFRFLLPCFHPSLDDHNSSAVPNPKLVKVRARVTNNEAVRGAEMTESSSQPSLPTLPTPALAPLARRSPIEIAKQHLRKSAKPSAGTRTTGPRAAAQLLPTPVTDTVTAAGAAAATSAANAHGGGGVQLPMDETEGVLSGAVVPPGKDTMAIRKSVSALRLTSKSLVAPDPDRSAGLSLPRAVSDAFDDIDDSDDDDEDRIVAMGGMGIPVGDDGLPRPLLPPLDPALLGRKCLVLDLDETLVHSSFKLIPQSDFVVPVEIENAVHNVHVIKRPGVDAFMKKMGEIYEVVVFTASLSKYADPVLDMLDINHVVKHRLFRESCYNHKGNYVKDLSQLGRPINETIIIDNSPASYVFHPNNAVPVSSWFNDPHDTELTDLAAFLTDIAHVPDVRWILDPRLLG